MAKRRLLLDCTLRDGGYINDWNFGHDNIVNIFSRLVNSHVDVVEIGFLDDRRCYDFNRTIMPNTDSVDLIFKGLEKKNTLVVGMIDYGTCSLDHIKPCNESFLDGIRVIFKKEKMTGAMEFCSELKKLGYKVFSQLVSIASYSKDDLKEIINLANKINPYALSMVDTYGLLDPIELKNIMTVLNSSLNKEIILGFHAHNNFQLGYINAVTALGFNTDRDVLVDGTLYGMGKSAGNAPLELIGMYMNEHLDKNYDINEMQEAIVSSIINFQSISPWGYQLFYYIAASNRVHPNYVSYLMSKKTLSISSINQILQQIPEGKKLEKDMQLVETLYSRYQLEECNDVNSIKELTTVFKNKKVLMIGPGSSIMSEVEIINKFIDKQDMVIISINFIPNDYKVDYVFFTNITRFVQSSTRLHLLNKKLKIIATSNLVKDDKSFDYVINYSSLIDPSAEFPDNSMCMMLKVLVKCSCDDVYLAGFDGYSLDCDNFYSSEKEYSFIHEKVNTLNEYGRTALMEISKDINIHFLTQSKYSFNTERVK